MKDYSVIVDFEMCNVKGKRRKYSHGLRSEIIQVGAVLLDEKFKIVDSFNEYVKPEYGKLDTVIRELTGIEDENLEHADGLQTVMNRFMNWIGNREFNIYSWSRSDYDQLKDEFIRKGLIDVKVKALFDNWIDFQRSFDDLIDIPEMYSTSLAEALKLACIDIKGREHDGLCDAYNTAALFRKLNISTEYELKHHDIRELSRRETHLTFTIADKFGKDLYETFGFNSEDNSIKSDEDNPENWSIRRKCFALLKGQKCAEGCEWNKYMFYINMKKQMVKEKSFISA